jgi:hypothetical protein
LLLTDKKISPLEVLTAVREEISKKDYDPFYLTVLGPQLECALKMNRRSLVWLKLKNGSTDLNNYFFILFALLQGWFKKKKNPKSCPENWKIREKLKVLFSVVTAGTIWQFFFLMFVIIRMRFLCKEKLEKLPGKLENSGKTESYYFFFVLFVIVVKKFSGKKNRNNYKRKSKNSGKLQKLLFLYAFSIITDDRNDIFD